MQQTYILTVLLFICVGGIALYMYSFLHGSKSVENLTTITATTSVAGDAIIWQKYNNTTYHYSLNYPSSSRVQPIQEMETATATESSAIEISVPGVQIIIWRKYNGLEPQTIERNRIISLDLKSFSDILHQKEVADKNPNFPNKKVEDITETTFAGEKAYTYLVTGSANGYGDNNYHLFTEHEGIKFEIIYPFDNKISERMLESFRFTGS